MLLGIVLAISTSSANFDVHAPGFWDRQYRIPTSTCFKTVFYVTPSAEKAAEDLDKCSPLRRPRQGPWEANCYLQPADADSLIRSVKEKWPILKSQEKCAPADMLPELDFMQSHLTREYAAMGISSAAFPSLAGLMDYRFMALARLLRRRDRSTMTALTLVAVLDGSSGTHDVHARNRFPRDEREGTIRSHPWFPSKVPACDQVGHFSMLYDADVGPPGRQDVRAAALKLGAPYVEKECRRAGGSLAAVIAKAPFKPGKSLTALPGLHYAIPFPRSLPTGILADDEKFDGLSKDAAALNSRLAAAPTLKSLIEAELNRLAPQADALRPLRQGVLVMVAAGKRVPTTTPPAPRAEPAAQDFEDPSFWRKSYRIPFPYCSEQIRLETPTFKTIAKAISKCAPPPAPDAPRWDAECRLPRSEADALINALKANGRILSYHQNCPDAERMPELDYKVRHLNEEANRIGLATAPWSGIRGLMEAQLGTINWIIGLRDTAALVRLNLSVVPQKRPLETELRPGPAERQPKPVNPFENHPWARTSAPVCQQIDHIDAEFDAPPGSAQEQALLRFIRGKGTPFTDPDCDLMTRSHPSHTAVFIRLPLTDIRNAMLSLKGLKRWSKSSRSKSPQSVPDDLKLQTLEKDIASAGQAMAAAPHIRALVRSEVERLRPQAERLATLRGGSLVIIRMDGR